MGTVPFMEKLRASQEFTEVQVVAACGADRQLIGDVGQRTGLGSPLPVRGDDVVARVEDSHKGLGSG